MKVTLAFEITLDSDYHVGSGHGDSLIDSILLRDGDGLPVIRGSTVAGLLRDGAWRLLNYGPLASARKCESSGLQGGADYCSASAQACPICRIFGTPGQPKKWQITSARPAERQTPGRSRAGARSGGTEAHRVRVDPKTRRAGPRMLLNQEQGEKDWTFVFEASTVQDAQSAMEEAALLVAAARAVRGLGRARRRGLGECRIHLTDRDEQATWLARFQAHWLQGQALQVEDEGDPKNLPDWSPSGDPVRIQIVARADEPVLVALRAQAGNEFETIGGIPGTALLGALAARAACEFDLDRDPQAKAAFVAIFLRGRVSFGTLLPAKYDQAVGRLIPTIPAPRDMLTCKAFPGFQRWDPAGYPQHDVTGYALAASGPSHCPQCAQTQVGPPLAAGVEVPLEPLSGLTPVDIKPEQYAPPRRHEMHIRVDPATGRVAQGDLYGYISLEAGQYFLGEIRCADKGAWDALRTLAGLPSQHEPFTIRVGRASRRGHGCLSLTWAEGGGFDSPSPWSALPLARRVPGQRPPGELVLTLLTDAILPDSWGRAQAGFDEAWMSELLQAPVTIVRAFSRSRQVDGFYGHLGLPRFRDVALTAGSTVGLRFDGPPPANLGVTLTKLEFEGIGLRREEGYGQVVFNHPLYDNLGALAANRVRIPNALQPSPGGKPLPLVTGDFKNDWAAKVAAYDLSVWAQVAFGPIARILREGARGPVAELKSSLNDERFGQARNLLGYDLGGPRKVKRVVLKTRDGRQKITELLDELLADQRLSQHPEVAAELQALAIEAIADRVGQGAALTRDEE